MNAEDIIDLPIPENDAGAGSIREYLKALLEQLWSEGEAFSGKRPFGNSGWDYELYICLAKIGAVEATFNEYDEIEEITYEEIRKANDLIFDCIKLL